MTVGRKLGSHVTLRVQDEATKWQSKVIRSPRKAKLKMPWSDKQSGSKGAQACGWSAGRLKINSAKKTYQKLRHWFTAI